MRKTKLLTQKRRLLTRYAKTGIRNRGSQQYHRKTNLAKLRKKTTDTEEKDPDPLRKDGVTEPRISTKLSQNKSGEVEKNKTTDTEAKAPKQPQKPKNVTRSIEASYAKWTKPRRKKTENTIRSQKRMYNTSEGKHNFINYPLKI